jgi:hypothetical protein
MRFLLRFDLEMVDFHVSSRLSSLGHEIEFAFPLLEVCCFGSARSFAIVLACSGTVSVAFGTSPARIQG